MIKATHLFKLGDVYTWSTIKNGKLIYVYGTLEYIDIDTVLLRGCYSNGDYDKVVAVARRSKYLNYFGSIYDV